jgi:RHS repeat-associated protein
MRSHPNIDWSWEGKEFFGLSQPTSSIVNGSTFIFNLRFPGQYADQETGLFQNGYREYDPSTGRYMEVDPLGLNAGWNPYNYVESNALNNYDSNGLILKLAEGEDFPNKQYQKYVPSYKGQALFDSAINYLRSGSLCADNMIGRLEQSSQVINVVLFEDINLSSSYDPKTHTVYWNPYQGLEAPGVNGNVFLSPALQLGHEFGHGDIDMFPLLYSKAEVDDFNGDGTNEENRNISETEWTEASELDQEGRTEGIRITHNGTPFKACNVISNKQC